MPWWSATLAPAARSATRHLYRLRGSLDGIVEQVREAIARALGQTASEAVREVVHAVLAEPTHEAALPAPYRERPAHSPSWWRESGSAGWPEEPQDLDDRERLQSFEDPNDWLRAADERETSPSNTPMPPDQARRSPWLQGLLAGCQAAAWWLRRQRGRLSLLAALGVGLVAALLAAAGGPLARLAAAALHACLGLVGLADNLLSGAAFLTGCTPC